MNDAVVAAVVSAVPATIASIAAWRRARSAEQQLRPSNGVPTAQIVEMTHEDVKELRTIVLTHIQTKDAH